MKGMIGKRDPQMTILGGAEAGRVFLYVSVWWALMLYVHPSSPLLDTKDSKPMRSCA